MAELTYFFTFKLLFYLGNDESRKSRTEFSPPSKSCKNILRRRNYDKLVWFNLALNFQFLEAPLSKKESYSKNKLYSKKTVVAFRYFLILTVNGMNSLEPLLASNFEQVAKSASRLALYLMREDMRDEEDNLTVQHTHDYFVISACKISAKLKERGMNRINLFLTFKFFRVLHFII